MQKVYSASSCWWFGRFGLNATQEFSSTRKHHARWWSQGLKTMRVTGWRRAPITWPRSWLSGRLFLSLVFSFFWPAGFLLFLKTCAWACTMLTFSCCPSGTLLFNIAGSSPAGLFQKKKKKTMIWLDADWSYEGLEFSITTSPDSMLTSKRK